MNTNDIRFIVNELSDREKSCSEDIDLENTEPLDSSRESGNEPSEK